MEPMPTDRLATERAADDASVRLAGDRAPGVPRGGTPVRLLWLTLGLISVLLGAIGVLLPVLPTTPFMILGAFAFSRSSPALERRLTGSRTFGPMIADWRANGAIAPRAKALAVGMMVLAPVITLALGLDGWIIAIQAVCLGGAALFVLTRPSAPRS